MVRVELADRFAAAGAVAETVLYEGYMLYPYRASSSKNQLRWQFGVLVPRAFSEADGSERWSMRTECLLDPGPAPVLAVRIRCLQAQHRGIEAAAAASDNGFVPVEAIEVDGRHHVAWDEAVDQVVDLPLLALHSLEIADHSHPFGFAGSRETELIRTSVGQVAGRIVRRRLAVDGRVRVTVARPDAASRFVKVAVTVENASPFLDAGAGRRDALARSLIASHTMVAVEGGVFVSLFDPPDGARPAAAACHNDGAFPVLVGEDDVVLSSPIILYDHPSVAPESPGNLYDATEIDEILALRVLALTDEEKAEARGTDARAAAIIDRCDDMPPEVWSRLHGAVRSLRSAAEPGAAGSGVDDREDPGPVPWWDPVADASVDPWGDRVRVGDVEIGKGTRVLLRPSRRSDAQDLFLAGRAATVAGVFTDVDGSQQVAVTVDDDPATAELIWQGRYLFFHPDEVEPLPGEDGPR
ncbi:MAG: hypothetical protein ACRDY3_00140 [Acidimicrobiales bacterium]